MKKVKKKWAFISYSHKDMLWAIRLKLKMIWFKLPDDIKNEFKDSKYLEPIFQDSDYLTSGELDPMIKQQLDASRYLIVVCSPNSAQSEWVNKEVSYFINEKYHCTDIDLSDYIIPYVLHDEPESDSGFDVKTHYPEALREFIRKRKEQNPNSDIQPIYMREKSEKYTEFFFKRILPTNFKCERSFAKVIVKVLREREFAEIWDIHKRRLRARWMKRIIAFIALLLILIYLLCPIKLEVSIKDESCNLPKASHPTLSVNGLYYPITSTDTTIIISDLAWYYLFKEISVRFQSDYYIPQKATCKIRWNHNGKIQIDALRDSTFAVYDGFVIDVKRMPIPDVYVKIEDKETLSNIDGYFRIVFPVERQTENKVIQLSKTNLRTIEETIEPTTNKEKKAQFLMFNK